MQIVFGIAAAMGLFLGAMGVCVWTAIVFGGVFLAIAEHVLDVWRTSR